MGTVYEAIDKRLDTTVALKESHFTDEQLGKQFEREARLLARLRHPAMTRVIDHFQDEAGQFLVMDFIPGEDLWEILKKKGGALAPPEVLAWGDQLLDALDYLHSQEPPVIHRDIKPQNLKLTKRNQIILLDFGLAKGFIGQMSRVTTSGSIFGYTPNYAPLEQIQGTGTDPRSDLYSLAATLYHLMTGNVPPDVLTRVTATTDGNPDPLPFANEINKEVKVEIAAVLKRAMAIGRNQRFATAAEMRQALRDASKSVDSIPEPQAPDLPSTIVTPPLAKRVRKQRARPLGQTTGIVVAPEPLEAEATVASPVAISSSSEQKFPEIPSTTMFAEPVGRIDRFAIVRRVGLAVLLIMLALLLGLIGKYSL
jgi:eukaryotic-like serine/threonine-protein kinase